MVYQGSGYLNGNGHIKAKPIVPPPRLFTQEELPNKAEWDKVCFQTLHSSSYPLSSRIVHNVPIYEAGDLNANDERLLDEWNHVLLSGPGVFVLKNMYTVAVVNKSNKAFSKIISREKEDSKGDHFSGGQNDRIWNSFSKHCLEDPASFVEYYSNPWLTKVCEAWLGPSFRVTAQVNVVKPGSPAQVSHRDYHLGFQTEEACSRFPKAIQVASQLLTLQGAVAHTDMPLESGPTRFLPFSQQLQAGFMIYRRPEFTSYFLDNYVSLPLEAGDGVFFNPALMHAAGANETADFDRSANLLQVSSAMGKTMESIDSIALVEACWDDLLRAFDNCDVRSAQVKAVITTLGEGYPFPTNLDRRPPAPGGMAPESEQDVLRRAFELRHNKEEVLYALRQMRKDSAP